ncbi:MAG TPA: alcohol dehydrogenase catalytic domain-containing protein, partial [Gaiellaceae bacterium]|nr:alcohol dehydrogenase catalytic domain-containing protein [Gaiellaceae bacterium]
MLRYEDADDPVAGPTEKLVHVRAAGINFMDLLIRQGRYPQAPELPVVPGREIAGEVDGRRVMALPRSGGYAELA